MEQENSSLKEENVRLHQWLCLDELMLSCHSSARGGKCAHEGEVTALMDELVETKYLLAIAMSRVEEEQSQRLAIMQAMDVL